MGFRPDLDLREILKDFEVFGGTPRLHQTPVSTPELLSVLDEPFVSPDAPDEPVRMGHGPSWCSSETALDLTPRICWDVNGYYRGLGVHWRATRKDLGEAFLRKRGHESLWLTYVMTQLLNPQIRRAYDCSPLGEPFLDDDFVQLAIKRRAHNEAYRRTMSGDATHRDDVLEEWGLSSVPGDDANETDRVDSDSGVRQDEPSYSQERWEWGYSFYLWRTVVASEFVLRRWQTLLLRELSALSSTLRFSVGLIGKESAAYVLEEQDEHFIIFLSESYDPTAEIAAQAVREFIIL